MSLFKFRLDIYFCLKYVYGISWIYFGLCLACSSVGRLIFYVSKIYTTKLQDKNWICALVAQLDRVFGYEPKGRGFASLQARIVVPLIEGLQFYIRDSNPLGGSSLQNTPINWLQRVRLINSPTPCIRFGVLLFLRIKKEDFCPLFFMDFNLARGILTLWQQ